MKKFAFLLLLLFVALGLGTIFLYTDTFLLEEIDIESGWIPKEEILQYATLHKGQNLFFLNRIDIIKKIRQDQRVDEVEFKKVYPAKLLLRVKPKIPFIKVIHGKQILLLDQKKNLIAIDFDYKDLTTIKDFAVQEFNLGKPLLFKDEELIHNALDLAELCQQAELTNIVIWQENGLIYLYLGEGFKASFGKGGDIEKKFNNFYTIYLDLLEKNINSGTINLTNPQAPTFLPFD
ncbi:MAG: FtsQ-type POTRA domain-containing protein [Tissierellia bacterium]|nr:FtsQ-type POTRA domain-containing protein [Tissierellia bacterium]